MPSLATWGEYAGCDGEICPGGCSDTATGDCALMTKAEVIPTSEDGVMYQLCGVDEVPGAIFDDVADATEKETKVYLHARFNLKVGVVLPVSRGEIQPFPFL